MILLARGIKDGKSFGFSVNPETSKIQMFSKNGELGFVDEYKYKLELYELSQKDAWYNSHSKYGDHPMRFLIIASIFFDSNVETEWDYEFDDALKSRDESFRTQWANDLYQSDQESQKE